LTIVGIVHEIPNTADYPIAATLLPRLHGKTAGYDIMLLDLPRFPEGLFPGVVGTGHEDSLHVACGEPRSQVSSHRPYRVEKIGLAEEVV
jgi:hypothetical protein